MNDPVVRNASIAEINRLQWTDGLSDEAIEEFASIAERVECKKGEYVHRATEILSGVYFITRGGVQATVLDIFGKQVLHRNLKRGAVIGLFSIAQPDQAKADFIATEPSTLLKLTFNDLHGLIARYPTLQANLYRVSGEMLRRLILVDRTKERPSVIALVHQSEASRKLTRLLLNRLNQIEATPGLVSDDETRKIDGIPFKNAIRNGKMMSAAEGRAHLKDWSNLGRIFIDFGADNELEHLGRMMNFADSVLWCVRPNDANSAIKMIRELQKDIPAWREKTRLVWLLDGDSRVVPSTPGLSDVVKSDFKISFSDPPANCGTLLERGVERIIHYLRGIKIGIALGGGAARGMAHLGVLQELERHGIDVDMIAGTSAGAMTGTLYASGLHVDYSVDRFVEDLRLPWFYRKIPGGGYWYLLYKYRRQKFDTMLRPYLEDFRLEQLPIPMHTVTVDLVQGGPVVRETGDAVTGILESINLPGLASPIIREGAALVDGGLVNNVPANVLVARGCNFVIASSVTAKLEQQFAGIASDGTRAKRKGPSSLQTLMRGHIVQSVNMNAVGVQPADFVIEPDVTMFDLSEFERTDELAEVGRKETAAVVSQLKDMLSKLDDKLFPSGGAAS